MKTKSMCPFAPPLAVMGSPVESNIPEAKKLTFTHALKSWPLVGREIELTNKVPSRNSTLEEFGPKRANPLSKNMPDEPPTVEPGAYPGKKSLKKSTGVPPPPAMN
jgi:hypothetical protein